MTSPISQSLQNRTTESVYPLTGSRGWIISIGFIAAAVALPAICHIFALPVRYILPMHWPVILAGLLFGLRGGLVVGSLAPISNYLLTGFPLQPKLLPMTLELVIYGAVTGYLIERGWNRYFAFTTALITGRLMFLSTIAITGATDGLGFWMFAFTSMFPGLIGGVVMVFILGMITPLLKKNKFKTSYTI